MAATYIFSNQQILDTSGDPIVGAKLESFAELTSTPLTTYSNDGLTNANANPAAGATTGNQVTGSDGRFGNIYLQALGYKFILKDAEGVTLWTHDEYDPDGGAAAFGDLPDNIFRVVDNGDGTKKLAFECSSITTGATRTVTIPDGSGTMVLAALTQTLTNKTIALGSNTVSGTTAQFNTALTDGSFTTLAGSETLTNKTIDLDANTITGTLAEFNTALQSASFTTLAGSETLTNKTLTTPTLTLKQSTTPTPTAEGDIQWDTDGNNFAVGDGSGTKTFSSDQAAAITGGTIDGTTIGDTTPAIGTFSGITSTGPIKTLDLWQSVGNSFMRISGGSNQSAGGNIALRGESFGAPNSMLFRRGATAAFQMDNAGDLTFFKDDGTTAGLTWDASTGILIVNVNDMNVANGGYQVAGTQVVGTQGATVADATDAASAITQLNALLARCRAHGLIDT